MAAWSSSDLDRIGHSEELELASDLGEGRLSQYTTMWVVRVGNDVYVRSAGGPNRTWFKTARESRGGRIRASGVETDVTFAESPVSIHGDIDDAYHAKYDRYGANIVAHVTGEQAESVTIRVLPK